MKNVQGIYLKVKENGQEWANYVKKRILHPEEEAFKQTMWSFVSFVSFFSVSFPRGISGKKK